jgi:hypothetical protein
MNRMASTLDFYRRTGEALRTDPTIAALCNAMDEMAYDPNTGLYEIFNRLLVYDFDGIADRILGGNRNLLDGLVAWYKCNDNQANTTVRDSFGLFDNTDGTAGRNTSLFSTKDGKIDRGFLFDSSEPDSIAIPGTAGNLEIEIDKPFSIAFQGQRLTSSILRCVFSTMVSTLDVGVLFLQSNIANRPVIRVFSGLTNYWDVTHDNQMDATDYACYVLTYDGSGLITGLNLYNNNNSGVTRSTTGTVTNFGTDGPITFGIDPRGIYTQSFDGYIDEIGVWNRELTAAEVADVYNSGNGTSFVQTALLDYLAWGFKLYLWDRSLAPLEKLDRLKRAINIKQKSGTPWAIKQAIEMVADPDKTDFSAHPIVITEGTGGEFFDGSWTYDGSVYYDSDYSPFKFDVSVPFSSVPSAVEQDIVRKAILSYQNERSHLEDLTFPGWAFGGDQDLVVDLLGYYKYDDNAGDLVVVDSHGLINGVASSNTSLLYNSSGKINSCFDMGYSSVAKVTHPMESSPGAIFDIDKTFFCSMWIYKSSNATTMFIAGNPITGWSGTVLISVGGTTWYFYMRNVSNYWYIPCTPSTGWNHVVMGNNGSGLPSGMKLFLDSVDQGAPTTTGTLITCSSTSDMSTGYGAVYAGYDERIDEVGFWSRTPTQALVDKLWNGGSGLTY